MRRRLRLLRVDRYPTLTGVFAMNLLDDETLERSAVVANCRMNRERVLVGSNGYDKELGLNPLDFLRERPGSHGRAAWLDLCCGSGRALIEATRTVREEGLGPRISIVGVDLVGKFLPLEPGLDGLRLVHRAERTCNAPLTRRRLTLILKGVGGGAPPMRLLGAFVTPR